MWVLFGKPEIFAKSSGIAKSRTIAFLACRIGMFFMSGMFGQCSTSLPMSNVK